ncbi:reverse transcriptase domain-containing protein [Tanacetum coccineum]
MLRYPRYLWPILVPWPSFSKHPPGGFENAIVIPPFQAENFELKPSLITLVQSKVFRGTELEEPHNHIRFFESITNNFRYPHVPITTVKLLLFPFSIDGAAKTWLDKEPPQSILTWEDLYANETFYEAWDRFKELLRKCPHHGFPLTHQIDTFYNALNFTDQDSLNSAAGGNFLDKMPDACLRIIESKAKVRHSRNSVSRVSTHAPPSSSLPSNVELSSFREEITSTVKDMLAINLKEMRNLVAPTPATVKAVEEKCITCGDRHHYSNCPLTRSVNDFPVFHDNIQQFQQTATVGNFIQRNSENRFPSVANQMRPPGFSQPNTNRNNQGMVPYQAPTPQSQVVTLNELEKFKKTNDANLQAMRNHITNLKTELRSEMQTIMQNQNNVLKNELTSEIKNMLGQFLNMNTASSSGSLPSNTIPNPKGEIKVITTRSGLTYDGPPAPPTPLEPSKESIPPLVVQSSYAPVEPTRAPDSSEPSPAQFDNSFQEIPKVNPNQTRIPYPERMRKDKQKDKSDVQLHKFLEMFKKLHFNISLAEALILMPKYTKMMKDLLSNKEKLLEVANTPLTENCSAVIMKKLPEKLGDPGRFLIPCDFIKMPQCMALADLGASINLMPLGIYQKLKLPELVPTKMSLELANGSLAYPTGIAEDVLVKVGQFSFPADFVVVDYEVNYRVPLILGRPFLRTARVLIDVYDEELILRDDGERLVLKPDGRHDKESVKMISIRDFSYDNPIRRVIHQPSGSPTLTSEPLLEFFSPSLSPSEGSDMLLGETNSFDPHNDNSSKLKAFCCDTEETKSGSTTFLTDASPSSHLLETSDDILEEFADELTHFSFTSEIDYQPFNVEADLRELEYLLNRDPTEDLVSIFKDSADSTKENLFDTSVEIFTNKHTLDYSSPPIWDDYDDDLSDLETVIYDDYDDPFDSKEEKIKESKLLIDYLDDLDSSESSDFLPFPKYDSFFHEDFSKVDALPSTVVEDKVFNPGIPIHEDLNVTKDKSSKEMFSSKSLEAFRVIPIFNEDLRCNQD